MTAKVNSISFGIATISQTPEPKAKSEYQINIAHFSAVDSSTI